MHRLLVNYRIIYSLRNFGISVVLALGLTIFFLTPVLANGAGPNSPTVGANVAISGGGSTWTSPGNVLASDSVYASDTMAGGAYGDYLSASGFGFAIPTTATITGIQADVEKYTTGANVQDYKVTLYNPSTSSYSSNLALTSVWPSSDSYVTYGGSSSLWGSAWTPTAVNSANFSVNVSSQNTDSGLGCVLGCNQNAYIDYVRVTITYVYSKSETSYRWYQNQNSLSTTLTPLAAQNTVAQAPVPGTPFRLRQLINAGVADPLNGQAFKLQYAFNGTTATCSTGFSGVTYADVTNTTPISFYANSSLSDGQNITSLSGDPTDGTNTVVPEDYLQSNTYFNNTQSALLANQDGEWDAALNDTSAAPGYYCFRIVSSTNALLSNYTILPDIQVLDQPPSSPASLSQAAAGVVVANGSWTNQTTLTFSGTATSGNYSDTLKLCVELEPIATAFTGVNTSCGSGVAYSGTPVALSDTISGLIDGTQYHWQARTQDVAGNYSAWVAYNTSPNFGVDTTPPAGGTVYDGNVAGTELTYNGGSLSQLSGNWTGFSDTSGITNYQYAIGTTTGGIDILNWTSTTASSVTSSSLVLHTGQVYYFSVKATDAAGNVGSVVSSSGQMVAPSLSFSASPTNLNFVSLGPNNPIPWTDTEVSTLSASSNAYNGYVIRAYMPQLLSNGSATIPSFTGGSYASPNTWTSSDVGFGYTSSATSIGGVDKFQSNPCPGGLALVTPGCYAPYASTSPGDIVAEQAGNVVGAAATDTFTITNRATVSPTQNAAPYSGYIVYSLTASY